MVSHQINKAQVVEPNNPKDKHRCESQLQAKYVANHLRDTSEADRVGIPEREINQLFRRFKIMQLSKETNSFTPETRRATPQEREAAINLLAKYLEEASEPQEMGFIACVAGIAIDKIYPEFAALKLSKADEVANSLFKKAANKLANDRQWLEAIEAEAEKLNATL